MRYAVIIILEKNFFPIKGKQGVNNCFKPLISSIFTTVASRLISEQKGKEKQILKLDTTPFKLSILNTLWNKLKFFFFIK